MPKSKKLALFLSLIGISSVCVAALSGAATATTKSAQTPHAPRYSWFQIKSADYANACLGDNGKTSRVTVGHCTSSDSDYWRLTSTSELLNESTGRCLSVTGTQPGVYLNKCANNHAQFWTRQEINVYAGGKLYFYNEYINAHSQESLGLNLGTYVVQESSGSTLWDLS